MSNTETASSNTLLAITQLRDLIFSGQLGAGTDHLEGELAERLGMSRTPVREALLRLECQGLVEVRRRKGVRITPFTPKDMAEVYDVLTELEGLAAARAAARNLNDDDLAPMVQAIADMEAAVAVCNRDDWAAADDIFHCELVRLGGNDRISMITQIMADQMRRARLVILYIRPAPMHSSKEHRKLVDAIRAGDADLAKQIQRQHRTVAKGLLLQLLERHHLSVL